MRCKYESFGCYECIHSSPPSGSSAIRGGKIVYCENVDSLVSEVIFFYRLLFFFSPVSNGSPPTLWNFFLLSASPVPLLHFSPLPPLNSSICSTPSHSLPFSHLNAFFSHAYLHPPVRQSCARCHVAATAFAQKASASARRVGLALRATREHAILAAKSTASATMGPACANLAGRESTVTLVSGARVHVGVFGCLVIFWWVWLMRLQKKEVLLLFFGCFPFTIILVLRNSHLFLPAVTHDLDVVVKGNLFLLRW